ncbi:hypothetical protein GT348_08210 [Aristophania vespae]|uniref:RNA-binding protein AU-1/Ribonuclease E/G domain-containing protein n=1 Tax=Aristophania vespae TaxID=2697033 RepID=A0A6P1NF74_9PROT|nr:ribonuclease E/G [Aristophania vespae]QHI96209.1 hypothetical protein GT348_08210 [Aristophania vespae]
MHIQLSGSPGELRFTLLQADHICDVALWRPGSPDGWQDQHLVRILSKESGLDGAFVQLESKEEGFLSTKAKLQEGQLVKAEVIRAAQNNKGLRLKLISQENDSTHTTPKLLKAGPHPLDDLCSQAPQAPIFYEDATLAAQIPAKFRPLLERIAQKETSFLDSEWEELLEPTIMVGPLTAHISVTPALTSIDLDSASHPDFEANVRAFKALTHQIRLRNLSGTILIDPAGIRTKKRPALLKFLQEAFFNEQDPLCPKVLGMTPSGLFEVVRPRRRPPLYESFSSPHGRGLAILRTILREKAQGTTLCAPASIIHALESDPKALIYFEREWGKKLHFSVSTEHSFRCWSLN